MALSEQEELEMLKLQKQKAMASDTSLPKNTAGQTIYPPQEEISKLGAAYDVATQPWSEYAKSGGAAVGYPQEGAAIGNDIQQGMDFIKKSVPSYLGGIPVAGKVLGPVSNMAAGMIPESPGGAAAQYLGGKLIGAAMPMAKKAVSYPAGWVGAKLADIVGGISGKDPEAIKVLAQNPTAMWKKATEIFSRAHQEGAINAIESDFAKHGKAIESLEDALTGNFGTSSYGKAPDVMLRGVFETSKFDAAKGGFHLPESIAENIKTSGSSGVGAESPGYRLYIQKMAQLKNNPRMSFGEALGIKRELQRAVDYGIEGANGLQAITDKSEIPIRNLANGLNKELKNSINDPSLKQAWIAKNNTYADVSAAREELRKQVMGTSARSTERKLVQLLKEGRYDDEVMARAQVMGSKTASALDDIKDHIAARQFHSISGSYRQGGGAAAGAFLGGVPGAAIGSLATSPMAVGYGASGVGGAANMASLMADQAAKFPHIVSGLSGAFARKLMGENKQGKQP